MAPLAHLPGLLRSALALALVLPLAAEGAKPPAAQAHKNQLPPLIDRDKFFGNPEIAGAQLSPDGKWIAFLKPYKDTRNVWVKKVGEPYSKGRLITADPKRPIPGFFWSRDGKQILFVQDKDGDENYNVYAVDPSAPVAAGKEVPEARNLTAAKGARAQILAVPKADPDTMYVGLNDRDASWHDVYKVKISTGERTLIRKNTERISGWVFDKQANLRLATRTTDKGDTEILRVDPEGFTKVYECNVFESAGPVNFHKDGKRVYLETNKGNRDLAELVLFDPTTGKEEKIESDPKNRVDFGNAIFSDLTDELLATTYEDEHTRIYWKNKAWEADYKLLQKLLPGREIGLGSMTNDEQLLMVNASSDRDPGTRYLFDRRTKKLTKEYTSREDLPREPLVAMQPIHYKSSDGLEIPAFLSLPKGIPAKDLPLVVVPHGGPWARDSWGYNPFAQFLANRGYAVLQPNFRGSTGYGKKFLNAGNKQWGDLMQDDITWGVKHLVANGTVDAKRVGIMGGSYGGYASLAGVAFTPDLYAAAVPIVGPSNLLTLLETIPPYWEAGRIIFHERMGNPNTPEGKKQLERQSPLNSADKIKTPLLIVQGANDPRVKKAESDQIVIALRDRNFPVEYLCAPDEGHGFARPVNSQAMFAAAEKFLAKYLKARYQEGGKPDVVKRLPEITVDPKTVVLAKKTDAASVGLPKAVAQPIAGTFNYAGTLALGPQNMPLSQVRTIKEEGGTWVITEATKLPMGDALDTTTIAKDTLVPQKRLVKQGPATIEMTFDGTKATGSLAMGAEPKPFSIELGGQAYAEGSASQDSLAALPLAEGYSVTFRNVDLQKQKVDLKQAKVVAQESVTVPAGTFKAWKVEITSAVGDPGSQNLWVDTATRKVVKTSAVLPQMGGAVITMELQK
ncbi:S9 family peptidase [Geothrix sp. PMB-07]|uniref:S9 family peptidase n=1 Tax=Geothrix sp. PMB-07 TaxID=3068640 RepID=UPI002741B247|nr:S9 family peptidase [Geothrix sp. PMB-07]WLT32597.1 S9 family peptidase [Geothrix sp. PMB-07]